MNDKPRILIVDDDVNTRKALQRIFEIRSYETEAAGTGQEALQKAQEKAFNLALLDARLPDMDGVDLLAPLQEIHPDLAVIIVTDYASLDTALRALNKGASSYILKPLNIDRMLATIRDVLEKQRLAIENRRLYEATLQELAERRKTEAALRESKERFRQAFENAALGMALVSLDGRFLKVNRYLCDILGYSEEELLARTFSDITHPDDVDISMRALRKMLAGEMDRLWLEKRCLHKRGQEVWVNLSASLLRDKSGEPLYFVTQTQDITSHKRQESQIEAARTYLQTLQESSPDSIIATDAKGRVMVFNQGAEELLGYRAAEIIGQAVDRLYPSKEDARDVMQAMRANAKGCVRNLETTLRHKEGRDIPVLISAAILRDADGREQGTVGYSKDITERKSKEARQAHLRSLLTTMNQVKHLVMHEKNVPAMLQGACEILKRNSICNVAWIGLLGETDQTVRAVARAGEAAAGVHLEFSLQEPGPTGYCVRTALRERRPFLVKDVRESQPCADCTIRAKLPHGGTLTVPLLYHEQCYGVLVIYSAYPWMLDKEETELLSELAGDLAMGLRAAEAEATLRKSEAKYRDLVETAQDLIWQCDVEGRFTFLNRAWEKTHGYKVEEMLGKRFTELQTPEVAARNIKEFSLLLSGGSLREHETTIIAKSGNVIHLVLNAMPLYDADRNIVGVQGTAHDITERVRSEDNRRTASDILHALNATPDVRDAFPVVASRLKAITGCARISLALLDESREWFTIFALDRPRAELDRNTRLHLSAASAAEDLLAGRPHLTPDLAAECDRPTARALYRAGHRSRVNLPLHVRDQVIGSLNLSWTQLAGYDERQLSLLGQIADAVGLAVERNRLFERVHAGSEQLRQLAQQVVSAQEEERQRVSHELHDEAGQALVALQISLQSLLTDLPPESETLRAQLREAVALTNTTMERIRQLAHDLRPPALDTVGLNATLEGFCLDFGRRTRLSIAYEGTELPSLSDAARICFYRVLQEALTNVARHAQADHVRIVLSSDTDTVSLSVEDDGQGFDLQADTSVSANAQGIGLLGMRERLKLLGGWLDVESRQGKGTCLVAHVPWKEAE